MRTTKNLMLVGALLLAISPLSTQAQVAAPPATGGTSSASPVVTSSSGPSPSVLEDLKQLGGDAWSALKDANFDNGINVEPFGLYHDGDIGGGLAITTANTNGVNIGFALATINDSANKRWDFYDATLSIQLGKSFTLPIFKLPAFAYIETGPAVNLAHPSTVLEQSVAGAKVFLGKKQKFTIGGGIGHNSEWSHDVFYVGHLGYAF